MRHASLQEAGISRPSWRPEGVGEAPAWEIPAKRGEGLRLELDFLLPCLAELRSIILVGSTAYGVQTSGSDLDLVLIARGDAVEKVCELVYGHELENALAGGGGPKKEYIVLSEPQVEGLFRIVSPFSYSIRCGRVLFDTGYLRGLLRQPFPRIPPREYYLKSLFENIVCQYYSVVKKMEGEARAMGCDSCCCRKKKGCRGISSATVLAGLIFRMLYLTLPYRGLMPLTKNDAMDFTETFYYPEIAGVVRGAAALLRGGRDVVSYLEYRSMKKTAARLFREIVTILGPQRDVRTILHDAARAIRGNFQSIENRRLKNCLV